ncbi:MAG: hypothetical protein LBQ80_04220 [Clostridium sp.]|jgi:hypothetical protein|nr:hypothetical protein [Clostridium sp.]
MKKTYKGQGIVWDGENNKVLVHFKGGAAEVTDRRTAALLDALGFKGETLEDEDTEPQDELLKLKKKELLQLAQDKGLTVKPGAKPEDIITAIREAEQQEE